MHQPKVDFNNKKFINLNQICNKELKIHQKKEKKIDREYSPICVGKIYIVWKKEKKIFYSKKKWGEEESK